MSADLAALLERVRKASTLHERMAQSHPSLARGLVQCLECKRVEKVDSAHCLRHGWPKCCGYTMTIDVDLSALDTGSGR